MLARFIMAVLLLFPFGAIAGTDLNVTLQVNMDTGDPVTGTLYVSWEDNTLCCSWELDSTGWADIYFPSINADAKLHLKFVGPDGLDWYDADTVPVKSGDADQFARLLNGHQVTVTLQRFGEGIQIEDMHLEAQ